MNAQQLYLAATTDEDSESRRTFTPERQTATIQKILKLVASDKLMDARQLLSNTVKNELPVKSCNFRTLCLIKASKVECLLGNGEIAKDTARMAMNLAAESMAKDPARVVGVIDASTCMAEALVLLKQYSEAAAMLEEAIRLCTEKGKEGGTRHGLALSMLGNIEALYLDKGEGGITRQLAAVSMVKEPKSLVDVLLSLATCLHNKASLAAAKSGNNKDEAAAYWDQAAVYYHKVLALEKGPTVRRALVLKSFAECMCQQNLNKEAETVLTAAARIFIEHGRTIDLINTWILIVKNSICLKNYDMARETNNMIVRKLKQMQDDAKTIPPEIALQVHAIGQVLVQMQVIEGQA